VNNGGNNVAPVPVVGTTDVVINQVLSAKAIPNTATTVRLTGRTAANEVAYGPAEQPLTVQNTFTNVPVNVTSLTIEYLANGTLLGTLVLPVALVEGADFVINDPDFTDAAPVATSFTYVKNIPGAQINVPFTVQVQVRDQFGNILSSANNSVSIALVAGPAGATLGGTKTANAVNGVATFADLTLDQLGDNFQLQVSSPGLADRPSNSFSVVNFAIGDFGSAGGITTFLVEVVDGVASLVYPTDYTHYFDLYDDFSIDDGGYDVFDGALQLTVGGVNFPENQNYLELTWSEQTYNVAPATAGASYHTPIDGNVTAYLPPAKRAEISQIVDLTGAVAPVTLSWSDEYQGDNGLDDALSSYSVSVLDPVTDEVLLVAFETDDGGSDTHTVNLDEVAGQQVKLRFQVLSSTNDDFTAAIDLVSIQDNTATEFVANGGFESDFTDWEIDSEDYEVNVRSGLRFLAGLQVQRTFYAPSTEPWGRMLDTFTNTTESPITTTVTYITNSGADSNANGTVVPGSDDQAVANTDDGGDDSDSGIVFFNQALTFADGDDLYETTLEITVQPGQSVGVVNFLILSGERSGNNAPTFINDQALAILAGFPGNTLYTTGMTPAELDSLVNLP
jgi:hypothetical protein